MRRVHVVGAGLAGLAAALDLADAGGIDVLLHEATRRAGGRCWSFHDPRLDRLIDNGNHLVLSGNRAVLDHCRRIGTLPLLEIAEVAELPFVDLADGRRWCLRLPDGPADLARGGLVLPPGIGAGVAGDVARLLLAGSGRTLAEAIPGRGAAWSRLWEPLSLAVLNAAPEAGAARPLAAVLRRTLLRGGRACRPVLMPQGLGPTLVDPSVERLAERGVRIAYGAALRRIVRAKGRVAALEFDDESIPLADGDAVILAAPAEAAGRLLDRPAPLPGPAILNAHFRVQPETAARAPRILGLLSGLAQWVFVRGDVVSVTVSNAGRGSPDDLLARLWSDVARALETNEAPLASRLLREASATFAATPESLSRRLTMRTDMANVFVAGDHAAAPLPSTLEGALLSGRAAAAAVRAG